MNSSGYPIANYHDSDTFIDGSLNIEGQIIVRDAEGQSEYLDSGKYVQTFSNPFFINNFFYNNDTYYTKNGNFITVSFNVGLLTPAFTFTSSRNQAFDVTVPSVDLFDTKMTTERPKGVGGNSLFQVSDIIYQTEGVIRVSLTASEASLNTERPLISNFKITYKLQGDDVPASAIIQGGGTGSGDVRNPMIENLNGGGYSINNIDNLTAQGTITANLISAPNVVSNPLTSVLDVNNLGLINVASINGAGGETKFGGDILRDVGEVNNSGTLLIDGNVGLDLNSLSGTVNMLTNVDCKTNQILNSSVIETDIVKANSGADLTLESLSIGSSVFITPNFLFRANAQEIELNTSGATLVLDVSGNTTLTANNIMNLNATDIAVSGLLDMTTNNIENATDIKCIELTANRLSANTGQDLKLSSAGGAVNLNNSGFVTMVGNNQLTILSPVISMSASGGITMGGELKLNDNKITSCSELSSANGDLIIKGLTNGGTFPASKISLEAFTVDLSQCPNGIQMGTHRITNAGLIAGQTISTNESITRKMNNIFYINQESDFPNPLVGGTYHIQDIIVMTQPLTITGDCSFFGMGRDSDSELRFQDTTTPSGYCINITDYNVSFQNLKLSNQSTNINLLNASNPSKSNFLLFTNSFITDCKNAEVFNIFGFDLVDLNQCLFMFNYTTNKHLYVDSSSKLQISSCEFLRQFEKGSSPANWGTANMVDLYGTMGAINISGCLFHAQQTQIGLYIDNAQTALENVVSGNTFISIGQTTGTNIEYDITLHPELVIEGNSGIINEKAVVEGSVQNNTIYTATIAGQYVPLNVPTITYPIINRFINTGSQIQYVGKKPITCLVNANINADHNDGKNDDCRFGNFQNGILVSSIGISINDGTAKAFSYNAILTLQQNDTIEFVVQNITAGTNTEGFRAIDVNATLVEI
jgi:hypothetical protein